MVERFFWNFSFPEHLTSHPQASLTKGVYTALPPVLQRIISTINTQAGTTAKWLNTTIHYVFLSTLWLMPMTFDNKTNMYVQQHSPFIASAFSTAAGMDSCVLDCKHVPSNSGQGISPVCIP